MTQIQRDRKAVGRKLEPLALNPKSLQEALAAVQLVRRIHFFEELPSTSLWARELVLNSGDSPLDGTLVVAAHQTSGRGRFQRSWHAPPGKALLFTLILQPTLDSASSVEAFGRHLSLAAPVAVCDAVREETGMPFDIKYPNDVLISDRKCAGILIERLSSGSQAAFLVGIGINVNQKTEELPSGTRIPPASMATASGNLFPLPAILRLVLEKLESELTAGLRHSAERMNFLCSTLGRFVRIEMENEMIEGHAISISDEGALLVRTESGCQRAIFSGDIFQLDTSVSPVTALG